MDIRKRDRKAEVTRMRGVFVVLEAYETRIRAERRDAIGNVKFQALTSGEKSGKLVRN